MPKWTKYRLQYYSTRKTIFSAEMMHSQRYGCVILLPGKSSPDSKASTRFSAVIELFVWVQPKIAELQQARQAEAECLSAQISKKHLLLLRRSYNGLLTPYLGRPDAFHLAQQPVLGCIQALQMLLRAATLWTKSKSSRVQRGVEITVQASTTGTCRCYCSVDGHP